jgi:hypothetical protein
VLEGELTMMAAGQGAAAPAGMAGTRWRFALSSVGALSVEQVPGPE